jgi:hypothetical protein
MRTIANYINQVEIINIERHKSPCGRYREIALDVHCESISNRWMKFELVPFEQVVPPEDGIYHYILEATNTRPEAPCELSTRITTQIIKEAPSDLVGLVIHSQNNSSALTMKSFEQFDHRFDSEKMNYKSLYALVFIFVLICFFILTR